MDISESRADLTLAAALKVLAPLLPMLLREGVMYPQLALALKTALLDAAPGVLLDGAVRLNDSSISTLTGVHRKDVRAWRAAGHPRSQPRSIGTAMSVFTRWSTDPEYCDASGSPRVLERKGGAGTFEALSASVSSDVHPRTVLQELLRLGVAELVAGASDGDEDRIRLCADAFVPRDGTPEMLQLLSDNVGDHLAAAVQNVLGAKPAMLEQSIYANRLRPGSVAQLHAMARELWHHALQQVVRKAKALRDEDTGRPDADQRVRVGMYFFHEPDANP